VSGLKTEFSEPNAILRMARTYSILSLLRGLEFESFLDVGGGEGYAAALVREVFKARVSTTDLSAAACERACEMFAVQGCAADAGRLPFRDGSYDLVLCSEVIEHLSQPVLAVSELVRISSMHVVITTEQLCPMGEVERALRMAQLDVSYPHAERNWFTPADFRVLLGDDILTFSQRLNLGGWAVRYFSERALTREQAARGLEFLTRTCTVDANHDGIIVLLTKGVSRAEPRPAPRLGDGEKGREVLDRILDGATGDHPSGCGAALDPMMLQSLQCVRCGGRLDPRAAGLECAGCGEVYEVRNGIPIFVAERRAPAAGGTEIEDAIRVLSRGELRRVHGIEELASRLHGARRAAVHPLQSRLAGILLRLLVFLGRPGSAWLKARRILARAARRPPPEFREIDEFVFAEPSEHNAATAAGASG
jgi:SAM-dependent methyltransferase